MPVCACVMTLQLHRRCGTVVGQAAALWQHVPPQQMLMVAWRAQALAATPVGFLRIVGFVLYWLMSRVAATERAKARLWQRQIQRYGPIVSLASLGSLCNSCLQSCCKLAANQGPAARMGARPLVRKSLAMHGISQCHLMPQLLTIVLSSWLEEVVSFARLRNASSCACAWRRARCSEDPLLVHSPTEVAPAVLASQRSGAIVLG